MIILAHRRNCDKIRQVSVLFSFNRYIIIVALLHSSHFFIAL